MPPDPCDIDSFSGSHATGLGSARISCFSPVFSSSVLEIPTQFPSPPARAPRASVHPSALGDPFHPAVPHCRAQELQTHGCSLCVCLCLSSTPLKEQWENLTGQELQCLGFHQSGILTSRFHVHFRLLCSLDGFLGSEKVRGPLLSTRFMYVLLL